MNNLSKIAEKVNRCRVDCVKCNKCSIKTAIIDDHATAYGIYCEMVSKLGFNIYVHNPSELKSEIMATIKFELS